MIGLEAVLANMARIEAEIVEREADGVAEGAETIARAWRDNIQSEGLVDTGHYLNSIEVRLEGPAAEIYTETEYARFLEFGTSRIAAHPVAERAFDEHQAEAIDDIADSIGHVL